MHGQKNIKLGMEFRIFCSTYFTHYCPVHKAVLRFVNSTVQFSLTLHNDTINLLSMAVVCTA